MQQRLEFIDLAKGIGMIMVIYLHVTINYSNKINIYAGSHWDIFVHSMFMPIFFILSGLFFSIKEPFKEWIVKKAKRLLIPFILFYILTYIINAILVTFFHIKLKSGFNYWDIFAVFYKDVYPNSAIWFLLALFWCSLYLWGILKATNKTWLQLLLVIICFSIGILLDKTETNIPLYIDTAFTSLPFLYLGYSIKKNNTVYRLQSQSKIVQICTMCIIAATCFIIDWLLGEGASMVNNSNGNPFIFLIGGVTGSLSIISFSFLIGRLPIVSYIGRYSMFVLCTHMFLTNLFVKLLSKFDISFLISSIIATISICLCYYIIIPSVKRIYFINTLL